MLCRKAMLPVGSHSGPRQKAVAKPVLVGIRPNRPISDLRFTLKAVPFGGSVKVNLRSEVGRFGLIVWVGACGYLGAQGI